MKKVIRLTESDIQKIVKRIITEKLGVPDNISETAESVVNFMISSFSKDNRPMNADETPNEISYMGRFKINDYEFYEVSIDFDARELADEDSEPLIVGFATLTPTKTVNYRLVYPMDELSTIRIRLSIGVGKQWRLSQIANALIGEKDKYISVMSHELHHAYHNYSKSSISPTTKTEYEANQSIHIGTVPPINKFLFYSYYINLTENVVRPSELYSVMRTRNITKNQFREFFESSDIIKQLKDIRNFRLETMISELHDYIPQIDQIFDLIENDQNLSISVERGNNDDEKVIRFLEVIYEILTSSKKTFYQQFLMTTIDPMDALKRFLGVPGSKNALEILDKMLDDYTKKIEKYKNYRNFFVNEEKRFIFVADKTIKKLSKLYDMASNDTKNLKESSIIDWDLYHKINKTQEKTIEELRKLFREGKLPSKNNDPKNTKKKKSN